MPQSQYQVNIQDQISGIIYGYYVRYARLIDQVNLAFRNSSASTIDIYIDLYDIFRKIDNRNFNPADLDEKLITSCVINMCAHYRNFFNKYYKTSTKFFIIAASDSTTMNSKFCDQYKYPKFKNDYMDKKYRDTTNMVLLISKYIPHIYVWDSSKFEFGSIAMHIIQNIAKNDEHNPALILSRDIYTLQLSAIYNNIYSLLPIKNIHGSSDDSLILDRQYSIMEYIYRNTCSSDKNRYQIDSRLTLIYMGIMGVSTRGMRGLMRKKKACSLLQQLGYLPISIKEYIEKLNVINNKPIDPHTIEIRVFTIDYAFQSQSIKDSTEVFVADFSKYLYDPEGLKYLNSHDLEKYPLDLNVL